MTARPDDLSAVYRQLTPDEIALLRRDVQEAGQYLDRLIAADKLKRT